MGQAIIIKNINFSSFNIGTVHRQGQPIPVTSISILGSSIVTNSETYSVSYIPSNTTQLGVTWSVISGSTYASIDSQTGELTVLDGASSNNVKIRATSIFNQSIYGELDIVVSYVVHDCSMEVSLINGDFTLHDWDNGVDIEPDYSSYISSDINGTLFHASKGSGLIYDIPTQDIKCISLDMFVNPQREGDLSNTWGGVMALSQINNGVAKRGKSIMSMNNYPINGIRMSPYGDETSEQMNIEISTNNWYRFCIVTDLDSEADQYHFNYKVYMNGVYIGENSYTAPAHDEICSLRNFYYYLVFANSWRFTYNGASSADTNPFCGKLRNIRVFRNELTEEQALFESTLN